MRRLLFAALLAAISATPAMAQLVDPGFEDPSLLTFDGPPFIGFWEGFNGGDASAAVTPTNPLSGASSLELNITGGGTFAGAFQDIAVAEGDEVTWKGFHALASGAEAGGTEIRIEWFDGGGGGLGATPNLTPVLTPDGLYVPFSLTEFAPAGAAAARLVYAIQSFGAPFPQTVFVDDVMGVVVPAVPEPTALAMVALAGLAVVARRRG